MGQYGTAVTASGTTYGEAGVTYTPSSNEQLMAIMAQATATMRVPQTIGNNRVVNTVNGTLGLIQGVGQVAAAGFEAVASDGALTPVAVLQAIGGLEQIYNSVQQLTNSGGPPNTGLPVQVPTAPVQLPVDYPGTWPTAPSTTDIALDVWEYTVPGYEYTTGPTVANLAQWIEASRYTGGLPLNGVGFVPTGPNSDSPVVVSGPTIQFGSVASDGSTPLVDYMAEVSSPSSGWAVDGTGEVYHDFSGPSDSGFYAKVIASPLAYAELSVASLVSLSAVSSAVWGAVNEYVTDGTDYGTLVAMLGNVEIALRGGGVRSADGLFAFVWTDSSVFYPLDFSVPAFDVTAIGEADTLESFLTSQNASWTVSVGSQPGMYDLVLTGGSSLWHCECQVTLAMFEYLKAYLYTPASGLPKRSTWGDLKTLFALIPVDY